MTDYEFRISFYKEKFAQYEAAHPGRLPSGSTIRRWVKECNKQLIAAHDGMG